MGDWMLIIVVIPPLGAGQHFLTPRHRISIWQAGSLCLDRQAGADRHRLVAPGASQMRGAICITPRPVRVASASGALVAAPLGYRCGHGYTSSASLAFRSALLGGR